jgi:hypothetical protein
VRVHLRPREGDPDGGIPPGTPFEDIPTTGSARSAARARGTSRSTSRERRAAPGRLADPSAGRGRRARGGAPRPAQPRAALHGRGLGSSPGGAFHDGEDATTPLRRCASSRRRPDRATRGRGAGALLALDHARGRAGELRFDTWFFAARAPDGAEATPDGGECVDARWLTPSGALEAHAGTSSRWSSRRSSILELPVRVDTVRRHGSPRRERRRMSRCLPKVACATDGPRIILPGERATKTPRGPLAPQTEAPVPC